MSGKRKKDYVAVFAAVLELLSQDGKQPKVMEFMMDFEAAMWQVNSLSVIFILNIFSNVRGDFIYGLRYRQTGNIYTYSIPSTSYYVRVGSLLNDSLQ